MSPNSDFITSFLNVKSDDIDVYNIKCIDDVCYVDIKLKRKKCSCEICGGKLIGHGTFNKTINHANLREHKCQIWYIVTSIHHINDSLSLCTPTW